MRFSHCFGRGTWAVMVAIAGLICAECSQGPTELQFLDLVAARGLAVDGKVLRAREVFAVDETWVAVSLTSGQRATAKLELGDDPVLTLRGCVVCEGSPETGVGGVLRAGVDTGGGRPLEFEIGLDAADGWWRREVDLGRAAGRRGQLWLEAELPEGCSLALQDATVRHRLPAAAATEPAPTQILLISVDSLRRDAVGALGGSVATPHLDRFAAEAEVWTRHYSAASWTKPSHASMLTGYFPDTHRALLLNQAMDPAIPTLADRFRVAGFSTSALVYDCGWLSPRWGFAKGFDSYQVSRWRAGRQARAAASWVLKHRDEPFFFFLHTFEPHSDFKRLPYEAPGLNRMTIAESFGIANFGCREGRCASQLVNALYRHEVPREPRDAEILRSTYDAGVRYLDASLGTLFDVLRSSGLWDRMLIVVTSDHGEAFGEHDGFGHHTLYEEILDVPLIVKWPRGDRAGAINDGLSSSVDLAPTLLDLAGITTDDLPGHDLRRRPDDAPVFSGTLARAVVRGYEKGIFGGIGPGRVFDLATDRGEELNLVESDPQLSRELEALLREHRRRALALYRRIGSQRESGEVILSEHERERLEAFGYLQ